MRDGFVKVAAGTPEIRVGDCRYNAEQIFTLMREASHQGVRILALPELCLTGSTCGDLFLQPTLIHGAREALGTILEATKSLDMLTALGMPILCENKLFNCAVLLHRGRVLAAVPKCHFSADSEQRRWFTSGAMESGMIDAFHPEGNSIPVVQTLLTCRTRSGLCVGVEIGEDLYAAAPPAQTLGMEGATVMLHLSAMAEIVGRAARRRELTATQSARLCCAYVCAGAGDGESTTGAAFAGHNLVAENGTILDERRFATGLTISEIDVVRLCQERRRSGLFVQPNGAGDQICTAVFDLEPATTNLTRPISATPFVPEDPAQRLERCEETIKIAALGLKKRLDHSGAHTAVVGLSGGLDSTLAVLITTVAMRLLDRPASDIIAVTMPCFGTTDRTRDNAVVLAQRLGATLRHIDISASVKSHFADIGQSMADHDITFENAQARERTQVLMDIANQTGGLVVGTGDLSELALGWCTYNGDQMSMYGVNAGIPKTLIRHLVRFVAGDKAEEDEALSNVLEDILDTPVSPELLPAVGGKIVQKTEDLLGPYELHDFFLYYAVRWAFPPKKILRLAEHAFARIYDRATILKWERVFYSRFLSQQFKRSSMPDGPRIGSVSLSPRGDWQMPSDACARLWLEELEELL